MKDGSEEVAVQGRANDLAARITGRSLQEVTKERSKNPRDRGIQQASNHTLEKLQAEFDEAMLDGGFEGKVRALAVKRVADAEGIPMDDVVDHHRTDRQRRAYADAQRFEATLHSIPSGRGIVENPYDGNRRGGAKSIGTYQSANKAMIAGRQQLFPSKRRRSWK